MFRIDVPTAVGVLPAVQPAGNPGYFMQVGNGASGTIVSPDWCNTIQEEMMSILAAAGVEEQKGNYTQIITSLRALFGQNYTLAQLGGLFNARGIANRKLIFFTNGGVNFPAGIDECYITMCGGGGGGGGSAAPSGGFAGAGGGGGAGASFFGGVAVTAGQLYLITIGAAGEPGSGGNGGNGGTTSFGSLVSCAGGFGGTYGEAAASSGAGGGAGGTGGTGGGAGFSLPGADLGFSGQGGSSIAGVGGTPTLNGVGQYGEGYGAGGSGGSNGNDGAPGSAGILIVEW